MRADDLVLRAREWPWQSWSRPSLPGLQNHSTGCDTMPNLPRKRVADTVKLNELTAGGTLLEICNEESTNQK